MSSTKQKPVAAKSTADDAEKKPKPAHQDSWRETIDSIVIAFILAFLFRTFEAEAFIIPTGSMAPTLMGRHKDVDCQSCGHHFRIGASVELDPELGYLLKDKEHEVRVETALCPNCRFVNNVRELPVFRGDRIIVNKFPYDIQDPKRWDVAVFRYPEDPRINYIKRVVALPGETIKIQRGDVYLKTEEGFEILRKDDPDKQRVLQIVVNDDNNVSKELQEIGWPEKWAAVTRSADGNGAAAPPQEGLTVAGWEPARAGWNADLSGRAYHLSLEDSKAEPRWLRYRHFDPSLDDWRDITNGQRVTPAARLVTDFCSYGAITKQGERTPEDQGDYWVGDLSVACQLEVGEIASEEARIMLELVEGIRRYRCRLDLNAKTATLYFVDELLDPNEERILSTAAVSIGAGQTFDVRLSNVDDRLNLWIDGSLVPFAEATTYHPASLPAPSAADLTPIGMQVSGAEVTASNLTVFRDIYYRASLLNPKYDMDHSDYSKVIEEYDNLSSRGHSLRAKLTDPVAWYEMYDEGLSANKAGENGLYKGVPFTFTLGPDEYFMMGDNSPHSKDSRLWGNTRSIGKLKPDTRYAVPRSALIGKAFFVFWPHGIPFGNGGKGYTVDLPVVDRLFYHRDRAGETVEKDYPQFTFPFYPQVSRMGRIR